MQNKFGKKLEEARIRRGVSIRQASDDLKIRPDFLVSFENDHGAFPMSNVYKIGFIKLYARYLKLNPDEIANDLNVNYEVNNKNREKEEREHLGRIELIKSETMQPIQNDLRSPKPIVEETQDEDLSYQNNTYSSSKALYTKLGLGIAGTVIAFILVTFIFNKILSSNKEETSSPSTHEKQIVDQMSQMMEDLTLSGEDTIHVVVRQENDKQRLFDGNIDKKHPVTISRQGPVKIHFSDGSKLTIEKPDGKKINPGREGKGWIEL